MDGEAEKMAKGRGVPKAERPSGLLPRRAYGISTRNRKEDLTMCVTFVTRKLMLPLCLQEC